MSIQRSSLLLLLLVGLLACWTTGTATLLIRNQTTQKIQKKWIHHISNKFQQYQISQKFQQYQIGQKFQKYLGYPAASYQLTDTYDSGNFFSQFNFFTGPDPTHGFVSYQSQAAAQTAGLININNNQIYLGVDHTTLNPGAGRASVRLTSNQVFTHGLFIADIAHMPGSICGIWPAYWMFGPNWPGSGEIDIIEGVNQATTNTITLHTSAGCVVDTAGSRAGTQLNHADCNTDAASTGCSTSNTVPNAYGDSFNHIGGGVYAMQWESTGIYVWYWPRGQIPSDVSSGNPMTASWGTPVVAFIGGRGCDIDSHFMNHNIIFDTTFCGDWAGATWGSSSCASSGSCASYVGGNPNAFAEAYWLINSIKVYQLT